MFLFGMAILCQLFLHFSQFSLHARRLRLLPTRRTARTCRPSPHGIRFPLAQIVADPLLQLGREPVIALFAGGLHVELVEFGPFLGSEFCWKLAQICAKTHFWSIFLSHSEQEKHLTHQVLPSAWNTSPPHGLPHLKQRWPYNWKWKINKLNFKKY